MSNNKIDPIIECQKLWLTHYGQNLTYEEAEVRLHALVGLLEIASEGISKRKTNVD